MTSGREGWDFGGSDILPEGRVEEGFEMLGVGYLLKWWHVHGLRTRQVGVDSAEICMECDNILDSREPCKIIGCHMTLPILNTSQAFVAAHTHTSLLCSEGRRAGTRLAYLSEHRPIRV